MDKVKRLEILIQHTNAMAPNNEATITLLSLVESGIAMRGNNASSSPSFNQMLLPILVLVLSVKLVAVLCRLNDAMRCVADDDESLARREEAGYENASHDRNNPTTSRSSSRTHVIDER